MQLSKRGRKVHVLVPDEGEYNRSSAMCASHALTWLQAVKAAMHDALRPPPAQYFLWQSTLASRHFSTPALYPCQTYNHPFLPLYFGPLMALARLNLHETQ